MLVLIVSNPPAYFTVLLPNIQVSLYLDIPDLDEDIFVRTCASGCDHNGCYTYKEESRSDHGRKEKVLFKVKFDFYLSPPAVTASAITTFRLPQYRASWEPGFHPVFERPPRHLSI